MSKALEIEALLSEKGLITKGETWEPLPGGQTNQLWRVGRAVVKSYAQPDGNPVFPNSPECEAAVLRALSGRGMSPGFLGQLRTNKQHFLVYEFLEGKAWATDAGQVGKLLRGLHEAPAPAGLRVLPGGSGPVSKRVAGFLEQLPADIAGWLSKHKPQMALPASERYVLLHGDPVPGNIVMTPHGARLIDWQCPAVGDAVEDLAIFLSPAMQWVYRGAALTWDERQAFLQAYRDSAIQQRLEKMQPWYHWAMTAYCAWKTQRGAKVYAQAMRLEMTALEQCLN
ncbi:phosphotransferase family protein [Thalassobius sp. S69A]|uniref:phosphotransferase family protein n=1 Tax=unclassified Thalassovita TaxID=2619711 RepID=UPI000C0E2852|nr:aminoglycoside phosphotransferase [Paracoccaceae bacterium]MBT26275.1 aminoglycoside phosphotransferase [Paracoccaceae bacterium]